MVHPLSIVLIGQSFRNVMMGCAYQFIYHRLKNNIKALGQKILLCISIDGNPIRVLKECKAQVPQLQCFVREVFVPYFHQPRLAHSLHILLKLLSTNQFVLDVDGRTETISSVQIV